ncbi:cupin domain-containing protein [Novosphingobium profundi]|uniref:cupin domain-containing protein n=1 Tax=Novosphingobium profundi TaxID=1774954 RepID=UPI001CFD375B|nr:DUF4437 domain-containing protein [Novosphingobium profundi]
MRPHIVDLAVDELAWEPLGPAGLYSRLLSRDAETGARTALQKLVPEDGYTPPQTAHYHHTYEEIIGISGCFSFDSRRWVEKGTYVFHPPQTVHGFASAIRTESTFLSRVGRDLDFNFVEEPEHDDLYPVEGANPARAAVALDHEDVLTNLAAGSFLESEAKVRLLSRHPEHGEGSAIVRLSAGWSSQIRRLPHYLEMFVMEGSVGVDGARIEPRRAYFFYPPETPINALSCHTDALVYVNFGGPLNL